MLSEDVLYVRVIMICSSICVHAGNNIFIDLSVFVLRCVISGKVWK